MSNEANGGTPDAAATQAAGATAEARTPTQPADEVKALHAKVGDLTDKLRKYEAAEKAREEKEKLARGEHEKVIGELKAQNERYMQDVVALQEELSEQWRECVAAIPANDKRFEGIFRVGEDGKELTIADLRYNLAEYRKLKKLGVLEAASSREQKHAPSAKSVTPVTTRASGGVNRNPLHW